MIEEDIIAIKLQIMGMIASKAECYPKHLVSPEYLGYYTNLVYDAIIGKQHKEVQRPFVVGDYVKLKTDKYGDSTVLIEEINDGGYITNGDHRNNIPFNESDKWEKI